MPRKIAGSEMSTIEESSDAMNTPRVVFESATHRYRSDGGALEASVSRAAMFVTSGGETYVDVYVNVRYLTRPGPHPPAGSPVGLPLLCSVRRRRRLTSASAASS